DLPFEPCAPEGRDNVYSAVPLFGAIDDVFAIRRPLRLPMPPRSLSDLDRIAATDLLHPDVELSPAIRTVGDITAVARPSRPVLQAFVESNACERALGWCQRSFVPLVDPNASCHQHHNHTNQR